MNIDQEIVCLIEVILLKMMTRMITN